MDNIIRKDSFIKSKLTGFCGLVLRSGWVKKRAVWLVLTARGHYTGSGETSIIFKDDAELISN